MTNWECRMTNGGPEWRFHAGLEPMCDGAGEIHTMFSTLISIAFLPAAPSAKCLASFLCIFT